MIRSSLRQLVLSLSLLAATASAEVPWLEGGHLKGRWITITYPEESLFRDSAGAVGHDQVGSLRLKFNASPGPLQLQADYQLLGQHGDSLTLAEEFEDLFLVPPAVPNDDFRWWDLTHEIDSGDDWALVQRLPPRIVR